MFLICELKEGTFLVLEIVQEYENSGKWVRVQGKYLPVIRRGIIENDGFLSGDNDHFEVLWKDYGGLLMTMEDHGRQ